MHNDTALLPAATAPEHHALSGELVTQAARLVRTVRARQHYAAGDRLLAILDQHGPLGVTAIAALDSTAQPTVTALVKGLLERDLVAKEPHPQDARASLVSLTDAGRRVLAQVRERNAAAVAGALADRPVSPEALREAVDLLAVVADALAAAPDPEPIHP